MSDRPQKKSECQAEDGYHWVKGSDQQSGYCRKDPS